MGCVRRCELALDAVSGKQWRPLFTDKLAAVVTAYKLNGVFLRAVVVVGCYRKLLEAGECVVLAPQRITYSIVREFINDQQLVQFMLDAWGVRSSQVDVYCLQGPLCAALIWDAVRCLCRVMFADRA